MTSKTNKTETKETQAPAEEKNFPSVFPQSEDLTVFQGMLMDEMTKEADIGAVISVKDGKFNINSTHNNFPVMHWLLNRVLMELSLLEKEQEFANAQEKVKAPE